MLSDIICMLERL
uniref:Uncharacterized protein n=1 Tax=Moniliophthora roreri TaxID=221103 RepID=A0A0W0FN63_MONRR